MYVLDELLLYCIFIHITFIAMLICWAVLEIELRTSHLLGTVYQALEPFYQFFLLFFFFDRVSIYSLTCPGAQSYLCFPI
jgi:hypothetical protein